METTLINAKKASDILKTKSAGKRSEAIRHIGRLIIQNQAEILQANEIDIKNAEQTGLSKAMIGRLLLNEAKLQAIAASMDEIAGQPDPIGEVLGGDTRPNGMRMLKVRVPLGVVGIIYESRPNVTVDCAALCLRSGNVSVLRGGKEAIHSNKAFAGILSKALKETGLPEHAVILLDDPDRSKMQALIKATKYVDLIIPRGGGGLIKYVSENASVPVVKHDKGVCTIYIDEEADFGKAVSIVNNAKTSYPSACNAVECVLVHEKIAEQFIPLMADNLKKAGVTLRGSEKVVEILDNKINAVAGDEWGAEYLDLILAVKTVSGIEEAMDYIATYGSAHSDAIITENYTKAQLFLQRVDSACVYVNASTRFTDGGEFGLGAEVGISTQKLHSRGPMGAYDLTTSKYMIYGDGQIR